MILQLEYFPLLLIIYLLYFLLIANGLSFKDIYSTGKYFDISCIFADLTETLVALNNEGPTYPKTIHFNLKKNLLSIYMYNIYYIFCWLYWLHRFRGIWALCKQEITNLWNHSRKTGNLITDLMLCKQRAEPLHHLCSIHVLKVLKRQLIKTVPDPDCNVDNSQWHRICRNAKDRNVIYEMHFLVIRLTRQT